MLQGLQRLRRRETPGRVLGRDRDHAAGQWRARDGHLPAPPAAKLYFSIDVPAGQTEAGDHHVRRHGRRRPVRQEGRPAHHEPAMTTGRSSSATTRSVSVNNPAAGNLVHHGPRIQRLRRASRCWPASAAASAPLLENGVPVTDLSGAAGQREDLSHRCARRPNQPGNQDVGRHGRRRPVRQVRLAPDHDRL